MDGKHFDAVTRGLAAATSRRRILAGLLGGAVVTQTGAESLAARRRRRGRRGESEIASLPIPPGTLAGGVFEASIQICHFDPETGGYEVLTVSPVSIPEYLNQGDTLYIDCCVDAECGVLPCFAASGCIEGACAYDPTPGTSCALIDGTTGVCDADGVCVASVLTAPVTG